MGFYIFLAVFILVILYVISLYNNLVTLRNGFKNAFAQIDVQLTRRYDLIPNLVETAKKYMQHEQETFEKVIQARNQASQIKIELSNDITPEKIKELSQVEGQLSQGLGKIFALAENYPELKADSTMKDLMEELTTTENKVAFSRQAYNDSVMDYNNAREVFPGNLIANNFGFQPAQLLDIPDTKARDRVQVKF